MTLDIPPFFTPAYCVPGSAAEPIESPRPALNRNKRGVAASDKMWPQHSVLKISLLNMTDEQKKIVKRNINQWAPHTNLYFKFTDSPDGDIRITARNDTDQAWSKLGTEAKKVRIPEPTMSIGFATTPEDLDATIQHEFGHALGLEHEHHHPDRTLDLNKPNIHNEYESRGGFAWQADEDIIRKLPRNQVRVSRYDQASIMHYGFPASRLNSGSPIPRPERVSAEDAQFMQSLYPPDNSFFGKLLNTATRAIINT